MLKQMVKECLNDTLYPTLDCDDGDSHFEEGVIDLSKVERGDILSGRIGVVSISFREMRAGGPFEWHDAPVRQFVVTLSGMLDFQTRTGEHFRLHPGDILLAEDTREPATAGNLSIRTPGAGPT